MPILQIPSGVKTFELTNGTFWIYNGILYSRPNPGPYVPLSRLQVEKEMSLLREITKGEKIGIIAESHPQTGSPSKEDRQFIADQINSITKAMAIITPN